MPRTKITLLGQLYFSEDGGLQYSVSMMEPPTVSASILSQSTRFESGASEFPLDVSSLLPDDFVVHRDHGVGRFRGLNRLRVKDTESEYLHLEYAGGDRLYVPIDQIDRVRKYVGGGRTLASVDRQRRAIQLTTYLVEALPNADDWPGIGKFPDLPKECASDEAAREQWRRACDAYKQALHSDPAYRQAAREFLERQRHEPQHLRHSWWAYRDKVLGLESTEPEGLRDKEAEILLVKHYVLRRERQYERVRREVEALENLEKLESGAREPIPESVRLFVWQRDRGQCVKCGSRERLEFDHIIPVVAGGSNTERNIQLLCESCNRSKGATI